MPLYLKLQTPSIECKAEATDGIGTKDSILVGVARYGTKKSQELLQEYNDYIITPEKETDDELLIRNQKLDTFTSAQILYFKDVTLNLEIDGKSIDYKIKDTREVEPLENYWSNSKECLKCLIEMYFDCTPWRLQFVKIILTSLHNLDLESDEIKNL